MLFVLVAALVHLLLSRTPLGVRIHMIGSNLEATRFSGVDTRRVQVWVYLLSSLLCWLAAVVMMARFNSAGADIAQSYLLVTILAAILGGIDPYGGFGRILGLFLALCILQVIASGYNLMGLSPHLALASWGLILLLVMATKRAATLLSGDRCLKRHSMQNQYIIPQKVFRFQFSWLRQPPDLTRSPTVPASEIARGFWPL